MNSYQYQENNRYFAQIAGSMEELGKQELEALGARKCAAVYRGVYFNADEKTLYRLVYTSRLATRFLAPIASFKCHDTDYLYKAGMQIPWSSFLRVDETFAIFANVSNSKIHHSKYAALRLKDAICDQFRERTGRRPSIDRKEPDVWFNVHIDNNTATISLDLAGGSLHRRGYRLEAGKAPMQETVAAAIIKLSEWQGEKPIYDPMCGSGTLLAEALMHYCRVPAGYLWVQFGFERLPDFNPKLWDTVKKEEDSNMRSLPEGLISGSDINMHMVRLARSNINRLPEGNKVSIDPKDFKELTSLENQVLVMNPPHGIRLGELEEMGALYTDIGDFFKQQCAGSTAYLYAGERSLLKKVGLRPSWKKPLVNGALDGRLAKYEMYAGSKKRTSAE